MTNNTKKRKVIVAIINRSDYSRTRSVIKVLLKRNDIETIITVLDSKYTNTSSVLKNDDLPVHHRVFISINERTRLKVALAISEVTKAFAEIFDKEKPDILVVLGDRYEVLGIVIAAVFQNIFVAHIQGGEVTGTHDENTRHAITKLSHLHFPATKLAGERIVKMGEDPNSVIVVGCPGTDMILEAPRLTFEELRYEIYKLTKRREILERLTPDFFLVMQFSVPTEIDEAKHQVVETLDALSSFSQSKLILTPIPDAGGDLVEETIREYEKRDSRVVVVKHLSPDLFANAMRLSKMMIGNSSAGIRETGYFGTPTINVGSRQNGREQSLNIKSAPHNKEAIISAIKKQLEHPEYKVEMVYGDGGAGKRIVEILASVDYSKIQKKLTY